VRFTPPHPLGHRGELLRRSRALGAHSRLAVGFADDDVAFLDSLERLDAELLKLFGTATGKIALAVGFELVDPIIQKTDDHVAATLGGSFEPTLDRLPRPRDGDRLDAVDAAADHLPRCGDDVLPYDALVTLVVRRSVALLEASDPVIEEVAIEEPSGILTDILNEGCELLATAITATRVLSRHGDHLRGRSPLGSVRRGGRSSARSPRPVSHRRSTPAW
jgi:hypothetical protein